MNPSDDKRLELLFGHYNDTYACIQAIVKSRDRFFLGTLAILAIMSFQIALPTESGNAIVEFARSKLGVESQVSVSFLSSSLIWAGLLFVVIRYFQIVVHLERQYKYIHALEAELSPLYSGIPFTREGKFYQVRYPWFSAMAHRLYNWVFPFALVLAATLKVTSEIRLPNVAPFALWTDIVIYALLIVATTLYLVHVFLQK